MADEEVKEELFFLDVITGEFESYFSNRDIKELYHYTSANGIKGILEENALWATHFSYLNDPNEIQYGIGIIKEVLKNELAQNIDVKVALDVFNILLEDGISEYNFLDDEIYISSFCEKDTLLGQWREYAQNGRGYCIGFNNTEGLIIGLYYKDIKEDAKFYPCLSPQPELYNYEEQKDLINTIFNKTVIKLDNDLNELESDKNIKFKIIIEYLKDLIIYILPLIKKKEFEEEKEWRIVSFSKNMGSKVFYRERNNILIPYQRLGFYKQDDKNAIVMPLPIKKILYGNNLNYKKAEHSLKSFLYNMDATGIEVLRSNIEIGE